MCVCDDWNFVLFEFLIFQRFDYNNNDDADDGQ